MSRSIKCMYLVQACKEHLELLVVHYCTHTQWFFLSMSQCGLSSAGWAGQKRAGPESARANPEHRGSGKNEQLPPATNICVSVHRSLQLRQQCLHTLHQNTNISIKPDTKCSRKPYQIIHRLPVRFISKDTLSWSNIDISNTIEISIHQRIPIFF